MAITLKHGSVSRTFTELYAKGFKPSDNFVATDYHRREFLDGSVRKKTTGFRRKFEIDLGILERADDLEFIGDFLNSNTQQIASYTWTDNNGSATETDLPVADTDPEWRSDWISGLEIGRNVVLRLEERVRRASFPLTDAGYGQTYGGAYGSVL